MARIKIISKKPLDRDITEIKGLNPLPFTEFKSNTDTKVVVVQNKCVFEVWPGVKGRVKTLGCAKTDKKAISIGRKEAKKILGK